MATVALLSQGVIVYFNPGLYCGNEYTSMRQVILKEGDYFKDPGYVKSANFGNGYYGIGAEEKGKEYEIYTGASDINSNFLCVSTFEKFEDYGAYLTLSTSWFIEDTFMDNHDYCFYVQVIAAKTNRDAFVQLNDDVLGVIDVAYACTPKFELKKTKEITLTPGSELPKAIADKINANADDYIQGFLPKVKPALSSLGNYDIDAVFQGIKNSLIWSEMASNLLFINAGISVVGGPTLCIFFASAVTLAKRRKEKRLIAQGVLPASSQEEAAKEPVTKEEMDSPPPEPKDLELPRRDPIERLVAKTRLRPVFGEWMVRGLGLALVMIGGILLRLIDYSVIDDTAKVLYPLFDTMATLGRLLLVVAIIGIIAETRKGLTGTSAIFFSLALTYYFVLNSLLLFVDSAIKADYGGVSISTLISVILPGNVFLSIGLFSFIGFFLFEEPPEWFINRKVFRALSAIPTLIALGSVAFSLLIASAAIKPNYWVSSFLFVRDFDGVFVGILFEFALFIFRAVSRKKYGDDKVDEEMERPAMQFKKNLALCGIVLLYVVIFYSFPPDWKSALNLSNHTFVYLLIPIFLFYKPTLRNRSGVSDVVYYAIYIFALALPSIVSFIIGR